MTDIMTDAQIRLTIKSLFKQAITCMNENNFDRAADNNREASELFKQIRDPSSIDDHVIIQTGIRIGLQLIADEMSKKNSVGGQTDGAKTETTTTKEVS